MKEIKQPFYSDNYRLDASFYLPSNINTISPDAPVYIPLSGHTGTKKIHPERFARSFTQAGALAFCFDYRGYQESEGPKGVVRLEDQESDISHAVSFVSEHELTKDRPKVLVGWAMGAGMMLEATRPEPKVDALVAINGFYNAVRVQKALRGEEGWQEFTDWLHKERAHTAQTGEISEVDTFDIYPLDPESRNHVFTELIKTPGYEEGIKVQRVLADSLVNFAPERNLDHLNKTPILIAHGDRNLLHPGGEALSLYVRYPGPKDIYCIPDAGHTEFMFDNNDKYKALVRKIIDWTDTTLNRQSNGEYYNYGQAAA
jgi:fermentation-respiration switch protein FrsA (DUF1100 family)